MKDPILNSNTENLRGIGIAALLASVFVTLRIRYGNEGPVLMYSWLAWITLGCAFQDREEHRISGDYFWIGILGRVIFLEADENIVLQLGKAMIGGLGVSGILLIGILGAEMCRKRRLMGGGDIKLICLTGVFLGWRGNWACLLLAGIFGLAYGLICGKKEFPWGPCVTAGAWVVMLAGSKGMTVM